MKLHSILILSLFTSILFSCSSDSGKSVNAIDTTATVVGAESFAKGVVLEKVQNLTDASQSYAVYLPADYSVEKTYPVINV